MPEMPESEKNLPHSNPQEAAQKRQNDQTKDGFPEEITFAPPEEDSPLGARKKEFKAKSSHLQGVSEEFKSEFERVEEEFKQLPDSVNKSIEELRKKAVKANVDISNKTQEIHDLVAGKIDKLFKNVRNCIIILSIIFAISYLIFNYSKLVDQSGKIQLGLDVLVWPTVVIASIVLLYHYNNRLKNNLVEEKKTLDSHMKSIGTITSEIGGKIPVNIPSLSSMNKLRVKIQEVSNEVTNYGLSFVPFAEDFLERKSRNYEQSIFANNLYRALRHYGFEDKDDKVFTWSLNFHPQSRSDGEWLDDASQEVSTITGKNPAVIKLVYYDYTGKTKPELARVWEIVKNDSGLVKELVNLIVNSENAIEYPDVLSTNANDTLIQLATSLDEFSLDAFKDAHYQFYTRLTTSRDHMLSALAEMGFKTNTFQDKIRQFVPSGAKDQWEKQLAKFVAETAGINCKCIEVFYYTISGQRDKSKESWNILRQKQNLFEELVVVLRRHNKLKISPSYNNVKGIAAKVLDIANSEPEFDFATLTSSIHREFAIIDDLKERLRVALDAHHLKIPSVESANEFHAFIPYSEKYLNDLIFDISLRVDAPNVFTKLLYGSRHDNKALEEAFTSIKSDKRTLELATFLIDKKIIKVDRTGQDESPKLALVLEYLRSFDLIELQRLYQGYSHLFEISRKLRQFLHSEQLIAKDNRLEFSELFDIIPDPASQNRLESIIAISKYLLEQEKNLSTEDILPISIACTCIFLVSQEDVSSSSICQRAQQIDLSCRILYLNMQAAESDEFKQETTPLRKTIDLAIAGAEVDEFFSEFRYGLAVGILHKNTKSMMLKRFNEMKNEVKAQLKNLDDVRAELEINRESLTAVMKLELPSDFIRYALQSQLIQAYVISTKSQKGKIIREIVDKRMRSICDKMAATESIYKDLLIFGDPDKDETIGHSTRIGVVPSHIGFEEFTKRFQLLFEKAVDQQIEESADKSYQRSNFSANIFRILATDSTFKHIALDGGRNGEGESDPLEMITNLVKNKFELEERLSLLATSMPSENRKVNVKNMLTNIFDQQLRIGGLLERKMKLVDEYADIQRVLSTDEFDNRFYKKMNVKSFTELVKLIQENTQTEEGRKDVIIQLNSVFEQVLKKSDINLDSGKIAQLSSALVETANRIGRVFFMH